MSKQPFALQDDWNQESMYQKLCRGTMRLDEPLDRNTKRETPSMNAPFGKKFNVDFKVKLFQEIIPKDSTEWNHSNGDGNSGMDAVAQANGIDCNPNTDQDESQEIARLTSDPPAKSYSPLKQKKPGFV